MSETAPTAPAQPAAPVVVPAAAAPEPAKETFSREYVSELRNENKGWRLKAQEQETAARAATEAKTAAEKARDEAVAAAKAEFETAKTAAEKAANDRILRAELKASALKAGMTDLDFLKLADLTKVTLDESGEVQGAEELMTSLKEAKPHWFGQPSQGTSSTATAPKPDQATPKTAKEMTKDERDKFLREHNAKHR